MFRISARSWQEERERRRHFCVFAKNERMCGLRIVWVRLGIDTRVGRTFAMRWCMLPPSNRWNEIGERCKMKWNSFNEKMLEMIYPFRWVRWTYSIWCAADLLFFFVIIRDCCRDMRSTTWLSSALTYWFCYRYRCARREPALMGRHINRTLPPRQSC